MLVITKKLRIMKFNSVVNHVAGNLIFLPFLATSQQNFYSYYDENQWSLGLPVSRALTKIWREFCFHGG